MVLNHHVFNLPIYARKGNKINLQSFKAVRLYVCHSRIVRADLDTAFVDVLNHQLSSVQHKSILLSCLRYRNLAICLELLLRHPLEHFINAAYRELEDNLDNFQRLSVARNVCDNFRLLIL